MIDSLLILVDENDQEIGQMGKMETHKLGLLHRAFSIFIFNSKGELLLQKRAMGKYHSAGLWSNTCCSHPQVGESIVEAAERRLQEEMGIRTTLKTIYSFIYQATFDNGLTEHEYDHVLVGNCDELPIINREEVSDYRYISLEDLTDEIHTMPDQYSIWLKICFAELKQQLQTIRVNKST